MVQDDTELSRKHRIVNEAMWKEKDVPRCSDNEKIKNETKRTDLEIERKREKEERNQDNVWEMR